MAAGGSSIRLVENSFIKGSTPPHYLKLPADDHGHMAAARWVKQRPGRSKSSAITERDRQDFVAFAADTYFAAVSKAIRKHDPNHMILGARFHSPAFRSGQTLTSVSRRFQNE